MCLEQDDRQQYLNIRAQLSGSRGPLDAAAAVGVGRRAHEADEAAGGAGHGRWQQSRRQFGQGLDFYYKKGV